MMNRGLGCLRYDHESRDIAERSVGPSRGGCMRRGLQPSAARRRANAHRSVDRARQPGKTGICRVAQSEEQAIENRTASVQFRPWQLRSLRFVVLPRGGVCRRG